MAETQKRTRREEREDIIKRLYQLDIMDETTVEPTGHPFVDDSVLSVLKHRDKIDQHIIDHLVNWKLSRLSYVDRAIIRFATYELWLTDTPAEIVINEALNLTRKYSDEGNNKTVGFTNKVLDNIAKSVKKAG